MDSLKHWFYHGFTTLKITSSIFSPVDHHLIWSRKSPWNPVFSGRLELEMLLNPWIGGFTSKTSLNIIDRWSSDFWMDNNIETYWNTIQFTAPGLFKAIPKSAENLGHPGANPGVCCVRCVDMCWQRLLLCRNRLSHVCVCVCVCVFVCVFLIQDGWKGHVCWVRSYGLLKNTHLRCCW